MRTSSTVLERRALSIALTGLLAVVSVGSERLHAQSGGESSAASTSLELAITAIVPELLDEYHVPGASVAVIREGEIESVLDFGVQRAGSASRVDEHTIFEVASLSKPVFAYGAHLLAQKGILDLDRPLSEYLESPYVDDPRLDRITARLVLSHSSGFPNWRPGGLWSDDPKPLLIEFDPGERFQYSGEGYVYLQRVVEHLTGETLDLYLKRAVLEPLGMTDSSFLWEERFEGNLASRHDGEGVPGREWRPREALAVGTLYTTASDYARFLQTLVADGTDSSMPLSSTSIEYMLTPHSSIDDSLGWSLGWGIERRDNGMLFWQWGENEGIKTLAAGSRSTGTAVVVLTNGQWGHDVGRPIMELVLGKARFLDFRMVNYRP